MTASAELMTFRPQVGPQEVFLGTAADIAIYGGAAGGGKTYSLLLEPLRHVRNPRFTALFFRQTSTQIRAPGGLWDESATIYPHLGAVPREVQLEWVFPGGATVKFGYLQYESDKYNYQGAQITLLCVAEGTLLRMGDGSLKAVQDLSAGDLVMTLEGPRPVTRTFAPRWEQCVRADVYDAEGRLVGSQVHPLTHPVLTRDGWRSYADIAGALRPSCSSSSTRSPHAGRCASPCHTRPYGCEQTPCSSPGDRRRQRGQEQSPGDHRAGWDSCAAVGPAGQGTDSATSACPHPAAWLPHVSSVPVVLHQPSAQSVGSCASLPVPAHGGAGVRTCSVLPGSQRHCSAGSRPYGGLPHHEPADGPARPLPQAGVAGHSPRCCRRDAQAPTQRHTPPTPRYDHPYTRQDRHATETVAAGSLDLTPCGPHRVYDLTVAEVNHYVTTSGLVNQNCFDELTHFSETQFFYMLSRNRSVSGIRPYVRAATNPDADSWVARFIAWWIDQDTGYPIPERAGVLRYFARVNEQLLWGDTPVAVREHAAEAGVLAAEIEPKSVTFIPARLTDNPALTRKDPGYLANLMAQTLVERERLLGGNWKIRATEGSVFRRAWFAQAMVDDVPRAARRVRYWDKAGTPGGGKFTCGVLMATLGGLYYVEDVIREQVGATAREALILETSRMDARQYGQVDVWIEQEPGSGGKESAENTIRNLAGFTIRAERVTGEKLVRARPFSAQVEPGNVKLKRGPWNTAYIEELVQCPDGLYWDQIDASSGAFNKLAIGGTEFRAATGGERSLATGYTPR